MGMFSPPSPPDPSQAVAAQARENRINVFSPTGAQIYGTTTLDENGNPVFNASGDGQASVQLNETPFQQDIRLSQEGVATDLTDLASTRAGMINNSLGNEFSLQDTTPAQVQSVTAPNLLTQLNNNSDQFGDFSNARRVDDRSMDVIDARDQALANNEIGNLRRSIDPRTSNLRGVIDRASEFQRDVDTRARAQEFAFNRAGEFTRGVDSRVGSVQGSINDRAGELDRRISTAGLHGLSTTGDFGADAAIQRNAVYNLGRSQLDPVFSEERERVVNDLTSRGIPVGSEAWNREMNRLDRSQGQQYRNLSDQSVAAGGREQSRLFDIASTARGQQFGERQAQAGFRNQATQQATNLEQQAGQFRNQAIQQMLQQELAAGNFRNQSTAMASAEDRAAAGFNNAANRDLFERNLAQNQFRNAATQAVSAEEQRAAAFNNALQDQAFQREMAANQFTNQALGQSQNMALARLGASVDATNSSQAMQERQTGLDFQRQQLANQALAQQFGQNAQAAAFTNNANQQGFANNVAAANFQNAQRQQSINEQLLQRNQNINEIAQLLGAAPSMPLPSMQTTPGQVDVITPTYAGFNAQNQQYMGNMSGLFGLGSAALTGLMLR